MLHQQLTTTRRPAQLIVYRRFRDNYFLNNADEGPLVEMYYYVSPMPTILLVNKSISSEIL